MNNLASLLENEHKNIKTAFSLYEKAANKNNPSGIFISSKIAIKLRKALFNLGLCYKLGKSCEKNLAKAFECFSKGASFGNSKGSISNIDLNS